MSPVANQLLEGLPPPSSAICRRRGSWSGREKRRDRQRHRPREVEAERTTETGQWKSKTPFPRHRRTEPHTFPQHTHALIETYKRGGGERQAGRQNHPCSGELERNDRDTARQTLEEEPEPNRESERHRHEGETDERCGAGAPRGGRCGQNQAQRHAEDGGCSPGRPGLGASAEQLLSLVLPGGAQPGLEGRGGVEGLGSGGVVWVLEGRQREGPLSLWKGAGQGAFGLEVGLQASGRSLG